MATQANLIATYNSNPILQKQYTLPQYLALFDFSQTPTTPTTPTPTPSPEVPGIPNIINQNLNQGGGGGDGPPPGPSYSRDDDLGTSDYQGTGPGFFESIMGIPAALAGTYQKFSPVSNFVKGLFKKKGITFNQVNLDAIAKEKARQEKERADFLAQQQRTNIASQLGGPDGKSGGQYAGGAAFASANPYGGSGTMNDLGADNFQDGGRVYLYNRLK